MTFVISLLPSFLPHFLPSVCPSLYIIPSFLPLFPLLPPSLPSFIPSTSFLPLSLSSFSLLPPYLPSSLPHLLLPFLPPQTGTFLTLTPPTFVSPSALTFSLRKKTVQPMPSFIFYFLFFLKLCLVEIKTYLCHDVEVPVHRAGSSLSAPTSWFWRAARVFATLR